MPKKPHRLEQVNSFIKQQFAEILARELDIPAGVLITVTEVKISKDLRYAKIGISVYPFEAAQSVFSSMRRQVKRLKFLLHQKITFKYSPAITLYLDAHTQKIYEMDSLLNRLKGREQT